MKVGTRLAALVLLLGVSACGSAPTSSIAQPTAVDIGFAQDMSVHHEQAVQMSQLALRFGTPTVRDLAMAILASQSQELGAMRGWLRVWNEPVVSPAPMSWMGMHSQASGGAMPSMPGMSMQEQPGPALMPGMATAEQMLELYRARGKAFDVLFEKLMIAHHVGGIQMDQAALAGHASALVADVARQEIGEQYSDLGLLRSLLAANGVKS